MTVTADPPNDKYQIRGPEALTFPVFAASYSACLRRSSPGMLLPLACWNG
jgi:hypothetical protein